MTTFANVPEILMAACLYGVTALGLVFLAFVAIVAVNRAKADEKRSQEAVHEYVVDLDQLEAELSMEFGPLSVEQGARFQ